MKFDFHRPVTGVLSVAALSLGLGAVACAGNADIQGKSGQAAENGEVSSTVSRPSDAAMGDNNSDGSMQSSDMGASAMDSSSVDASDRQGRTARPSDAAKGDATIDSRSVDASSTDSEGANKGDIDAAEGQSSGNGDLVARPSDAAKE